MATPASNNLSWQWVASTFAAKAYIFNRENLERYTAGKYCWVCPHAGDGTCPFEADYDGLSQSLFPRMGDAEDYATLPSPPRAFVQVNAEKDGPRKAGKALVWIHTDGLNPESPMLGEPAVFVWDQAWLEGEGITLKRLVFLAECLREMPGTVEMRVGDPGAEVLAAAQGLRGGGGGGAKDARPQVEGGGRCGGEGGGGELV